MKECQAKNQSGRLKQKSPDSLTKTKARSNSASRLLNSASRFLTPNSAGRLLNSASRFLTHLTPNSAGRLLNSASRFLTHLERVPVAFERANLAIFGG